MKLISCYIEKFGGLSGYGLDFDQGVTVIHAPNGFGKTTFAEFLRAMFYGFPRKAKTLDKSRRQKYTPWSGGKFGGNLVFEHEGRRYRLERTFGATPRSDSFNLIDLETGSKSDRFTEEIGLELFQLDADSFERSTYLPQIHDISTLTTTGIQAKLGDLVEDTGDINNFDKAMTALKLSRSGFIPYRGSGGSVAEATAQITRVQQELDLAREQENQLECWTAKIEEIKAQIEQKQAEIDENRKQWERASEAAAARRQRADLQSRHAAAASELELLRKRYPRGIPGEQELDAAREIADELAMLEGAGLTGRERVQYEKLRAAYDAGMLEEARLEALAEQNRQLLRQRAALENLTVSEEDRRRLDDLNGFFAHGIPGADEIQSCRNTAARCDELRRENEELEERAANIPPVKNDPLLLIPGTAGIAAGVILMILRSFAPGGMLLAAGIVLLAVCLALGGRRRSEMQQQLSQLRRQIEGNEQRIAEDDAAVRAFLGDYGLEGDTYTALDEIRRCREEAAVLREKLHILKEKRIAQEKLIRRTEEELHAQLGADDFDRAVSNLRLARDRVTAWMEQEKLWNEKCAVCEAKLHGILASYGLVPDADLRRQLQQMRDDRRAWENAEPQEKQLAEQLRQLPEIPAESADPEMLKEAGRQLDSEMMTLKDALLGSRRHVSVLQTQAQQIPELSDELARWQERKAQHQRSAAILDDTMDFLTKARESLNTSYLGPIRESFDKYLTRLSAGQQETVFISPELQVQLERQGQARELAYFSAGQTDLVMLCMRFALVDALFRDTKPFVVLDDPFVNLDDEHSAEALRLLENLGEERQIIYLTCSSSRVI